MPLVALIDFGNKSLHAWVRVSEVHTLNEWETNIEQALFDSCLKSIGLDTACRNPSRMSRLPGCIRKKTGRWQKLLYLNPEAGVDTDLLQNPHIGVEGVLRFDDKYVYCDNCDSN